MGMPIPTTCEKCGAPISKGSTFRLRMDERLPQDWKTTAKWRTDEFRRYYCAYCAAEVKKAVRRYEMGDE